MLAPDAFPVIWMKEPARAGTPPLLKRNAVKFEHSPIDIETTAIRSQYADVLRSEVKDLPKLQLLLLDCLLRPLTLCNVLARHQDNLIVRSSDRPGRFPDPNHGTILAHFAQLPTHRLAELLQTQGDVLWNRLAIGLINHIQHWMTGQFGDGVAKLFTPERVHRQDGARRVYHKVHGGVVLKDIPPLLLTCP